VQIGDAKTVRWLFRHATRLKIAGPFSRLGIATIWSQKKPRGAILVTGSHRRHPAGGLLRGRGLLDARPLFSEQQSAPKISCSAVC